MDRFKYFEEILYCEKKLLTTKQDIFDYIRDIGGIFAYNTFNTKLKQIEKYLYFSSFDFGNPMYLSLIQLALPDCKEILFIHKMMFNYLRSHSFIEFKEGQCTIESYKMTKFSWCIPHHFMPIFSAYLLSATGHKESTIENFFSSWKDYLEQSFRYVFLPLSNEMFTVYYNWATQYLGETYFYTLTTIYKKYSDTTAKQKILQDSIHSLTLLLAENSMVCSPLSSYFISMLRNYDNILASYPYNILYDYEKTLPVTSEFDFIHTYLDTLTFLSERLLDKIQNNIKTNPLSNSSYAIAINNFQNISKQYEHDLDCISQISNSFNKDFETFFQDTYNDSQISKAIQNGRLVIHKDIEQAHISQISKNVQKYYIKIIDYFRSFIKYQEKSCSSTAMNYKTLTLDIDYMYELEKDIKKELKNFKKYLDRESQNPPMIFSIRCLGKIYSWEYPSVPWYPKDILRLIYSISSKYNFKSPDALINRIENNGFAFPLSRNRVADLLTCFNDIFE